MRKVILFGTSAGARNAWATLSCDSRYEVVAFTVDRDFLKEPTFCGLPVLPFEEIQSRCPPEGHDMLVAIYANGMNKLRALKCEEARGKGYSLIQYIHPQAIVARDVEIGDNCFVSEGVICRSFAKIGNDVILMPGATIGHDTVIKDHCFVGNRAVVLGMVTVGEYSFIGPNATILEAVTIGEECLIGGGVVILESTREKEVYKAPAPIKLPLPSDKLAKIVFRRSM